MKNSSGNTRSCMLLDISLESLSYRRDWAVEQGQLSYMQKRFFRERPFHLFLVYPMTLYQLKKCFNMMVFP